MLTPTAPWTLLCPLPIRRTLYEAATTIGTGTLLWCIRMGTAVGLQRLTDGSWCATCPHCDRQVGLVALDVVTALPVLDPDTAAPTFESDTTAFLAAWQCAFWRHPALHRFKIATVAMATAAAQSGQINTDPTSLRRLTVASRLRSTAGLRAVVQRLVDAQLVHATDQAWSLILPHQRGQ